MNKYQDKIKQLINVTRINVSIQLQKKKKSNNYDNNYDYSNLSN